MTGLLAFDGLRYRRADASVVRFAFDLLELDGRDLRRETLEVRKATLASVLRKAAPGVPLNEHLEHEEGKVVFRHACKLVLEGIVSKRKGSPYRSGRSPDWLKMKNLEAPAVYGLDVLALLHAPRSRLNFVLHNSASCLSGSEPTPPLVDVIMA